MKAASTLSSQKPNYPTKKSGCNFIRTQLKSHLPVERWHWTARGGRVPRKVLPGTRWKHMKASRVSVFTENDRECKREKEAMCPGSSDYTRVTKASLRMISPLSLFILRILEGIRWTGSHSHIDEKKRNWWARRVAGISRSRIKWLARDGAAARKHGCSGIALICYPWTLEP